MTKYHLYNILYELWIVNTYYGKSPISLEPEAPPFGAEAPNNSRHRWMISVDWQQRKNLQKMATTIKNCQAFSSSSSS